MIFNNMFIIKVCILDVHNFKDEVDFIFIPAFLLFLIFLTYSLKKKK